MKTTLEVSIYIYSCANSATFVRYCVALIQIKKKRYLRQPHQYCLHLALSITLSHLTQTLILEDAVAISDQGTKRKAAYNRFWAEIFHSHVSKPWRC